METQTLAAYLPNPQKLAALGESLADALAAERIAIAERNLNALAGILSRKSAILDALHDAGAGHPAVAMRWPELHAYMQRQEVTQRDNGREMASWVAEIGNELAGIRGAITALHRFQQQFFATARSQVSPQLLGWG